MRSLLGLSLLAIYLVLFFVSSRKNRDLFCPLCIFALLHILRYVPRIISGAKDTIVLSPDILVNVFLVELCAVFFVWFGYASYRRDYSKKYYITYSRIENHDSLDRIFFYGGIVSSIIGLLMCFIFINNCGGIAYILSNPKDQSFFAGKTYLSSLRFIALFGALLLKSSKKRGSAFLSFIVIALYIGSYLIFTSRSPVFEAIIMMLMVSNYTERRLHIRDVFRPKYFLILVAAVFVIIVMPQIRNTGGLLGGGTYSIEKGTLFDSFFSQFSYVGRDAFVYNSFNVSNFWYGRNIINLICAPLPSAFFPWKPSVDDGMYLYNMIKGVTVMPPSNDLPFYNSLPFSTSSGMYANFGIIGVCIGWFFLGRVYAKVYKTLLDVGGDTLFIIIYFAIVYQLELSSLSIVQALIPIVYGLVYYKIFLHWRLEHEHLG